MAPQRGRGGSRGGGRGAAGGRGAGAAAPADNPPGLKRAGGAMSAKAKKEYLQWKRQQKATRAGEGSDSEVEEEGGHAAAAAAAGGGDNRGSRKHDSSGEDSGSEEDGSSSSGSGDDKEEQENDGRAAPAPATAAQRARAANAAAAREHAADARNTPPSAADMEAPLVYRPLVDLGTLGFGGGAAGSGAPDKMGRLLAEEVGQTEEGLTLGMPTRPAWQVNVWGGALALDPALKAGDSMQEVALPLLLNGNRPFNQHPPLEPNRRRPGRRALGRAAARAGGGRL
jgi:hypothetical protein